MRLKTLLKHLIFNNRPLWPLFSTGTALCCCLLLSGCPSASNPTLPQPQTPPPSGSESQAQSPASPSGAEPATPAEGSAGAAEPTFSEQAVGAQGLPDMRDEPSLEDVSGAPASVPGAPDATAEGNASASQPPGGGAAGQQTGGANGTGSESGSGSYGTTMGMPPGGGSGGGSGGTLTPAEQVAILDAQLEKGAGDFDAIILKTEAEQRQAARTQATKRPPTPIGSAGSGSGSDSGGVPGGSEGEGEDGNSPYEDGTADAGGYSTGGGIGGASAGGGVPQNTAKYPTPADIPNGNDDDVVARQLREAASREPDPAVRKKLWDEYRKYKGIGQ